jgi:hypothetical protein
MIKPEFIFSPGIAWSGTTSLYLTLIKNNYLNGGFLKEPPYLDNVHGVKIYNPIHKDPYDMNSPNFVKKEFLKTYHDVVNNSGENCNQVLDNQIESLSKFSVEQIESYFENNTCTTENYIRYYKDLYEYSKDTFTAVGDFANSKIAFSKDILQKIKNDLEPHFNVKVITILRDPIRRSFSHSSFLCHKVNRNDFLYTSLGIILNLANYAEFIKNYQEIFGKENVCYLIMEDFFDPNNTEEKQKLENFINKKIDTIHPCCFVPDKGINAPKIKGLQDQWDSDHHVLTEEIYMLSKLEINQVYKDFEKFHGYLPANWGNPIDYGYDA